MNRMMRAATAAILVASTVGSTGCYPRTGVTHEDRYRNAVDTAYPERYNYAARQSVVAPFAQQVANGEQINQTIATWYFDDGKDALNGAGKAKLDSIARSTPRPNTKLYLQAARDARVTEGSGDTINAIRDELDAKRAAAIQNYMATQPGNTVVYEIAMVDSPTSGIYSPFAITAFRGQAAGYQGTLQGGGPGSQATLSSGSSLGTGVNTAGTGAGTGQGTGTGTGAGTGTGTGPGTTPR